MKVIEVINNREGAVLAMVLIVLVATIIIGVFIMRSSTTEMRIAGNERAYVDDFYSADGASQFATSRMDEVASNLANLNTTMDQDITGNIKSLLDTTGTKKPLNGNPVILIRLDGDKNQVQVPEGSGTSLGSSTAQYYIVKSGNGSQQIETRIWKAFPKQTDDKE